MSGTVVDYGVTCGGLLSRMNQNDRSITAFVMIGHALVHTYELSIPILMTIWLLEFSVTAATLGIIVSIGYALFGIGALPGGILSDRFGSKRLIVLCLLGMGGSFLLLSLASSVVMIAVALCLWGVAASVYHPSGLALISNGVQDRGDGFAYHGMAGNIGIAFGPFLTVLLLLFFEWQTTSALLAMPAFAGVVYAVTADFDERAAVQAADGGREPSSERPSVTVFVRDSKRLFAGGFAVVFTLVMFNGLFYRGTLTFLPELLSDFLPPETVDLSLLDSNSPVASEFDSSRYVYVGLLTAGIAGQYAGGKLTSRVRTEYALAGTFLLISLLGAVFVPIAGLGTASLLSMSVAFGFALFMIQPLYQSAIAEYTSADDRGLSYGFTYLSNFGIGALGAAFAGVLLSTFTPGKTFLALALFPLLGATLSAVLLFKYS